jgi:hypothetical protein
MIVAPILSDKDSSLRPHRASKRWK